MKVLSHLLNEMLKNEQYFFTSELEDEVCEISGRMQQHFLIKSTVRGSHRYLLGASLLR